MCRTQSLYGSNAGNDFKRQRKPQRNPRRNAQRAVIKRRIAPDQQRHTRPATGCNMRADLRLPYRGNGVVPVCDAGQIVWCGGITHRKVEGFDPGGRIGYAGLADCQTQTGQLSLVLALQRHKDQVGVIHRFRRLGGDVIRVTGADTYQEKLDHLCLRARKRRSPFGLRPTFKRAAIRPRRTDGG